MESLAQARVHREMKQRVEGIRAVDENDGGFRSVGRGPRRLPDRAIDKDSGARVSSRRVDRTRRSGREEHYGKHRGKEGRHGGWVGEVPYNAWLCNATLDSCQAYPMNGESHAENERIMATS
jgi:hypothetical protein